MPRKLARGNSSRQTVTKSFRTASSKSCRKSCTCCCCCCTTINHVLCYNHDVNLFLVSTIRRTSSHRTNASRAPKALNSSSSAFACLCDSQCTQPCRRQRRKIPSRHSIRLEGAATRIGYRTRQASAESKQPPHVQTSPQAACEMQTNLWHTEEREARHRPRHHHDQRHQPPPPDLDIQESQIPPRCQTATRRQSPTRQRKTPCRPCMHSKHPTPCRRHLESVEEMASKAEARGRCAKRRTSRRRLASRRTRTRGGASCPSVVPCRQLISRERRLRHWRRTRRRPRRNASTAGAPSSRFLLQPPPRLSVPCRARSLRSRQGKRAWERRTSSSSRVACARLRSTRAIDATHGRQPRPRMRTSRRELLAHPRCHPRCTLQWTPPVPPRCWRLLEVDRLHAVQLYCSRVARSVWAPLSRARTRSTRSPARVRRRGAPPWIPPDCHPDPRARRARAISAAFAKAVQVPRMTSAAARHP
mmetsp:Transcript_10819/g.24436  ORF Transcript_10819/g.24436 Transcript_10819/m.24436 type:complete len:474 (-) Transcript_10819:448-1869(-)